MILVIDNYDSFVHNLARHFRLLDCETEVVRNDELGIENIRDLNPEAIVISPGPCTPDKSGVCLDVVRELYREFPIFGICLGHQAIIQALGGKITRGRRPVHGRGSLVWHEGSKLFEGIANPFQVGRYHSLVADIESMPRDLIVTSRTRSGTVMSVEHRSLPVVGVQFHPESILTESGLQLIENFLKGISETTMVKADDH